MELQQLHKYLAAKPESIEDFPFGPEVSVYKVRGKMFALLTRRNGIWGMNLKCHPDEAVALRDMFQCITTGYHMNKKHWITVYFGEQEYGPLPPNGEIMRLIDNSFDLVVATLPKKQRVALLQ